MSTLETNSIGKYSGNNVSIDDALNLKSYTTAQRDALTSVAGDTIFNSTDSKIQFYDGSSWQDTATATFSADYLIVAGGGGGGYSAQARLAMGGAGAGGLIGSYNNEGTGGGGSSLDSITIIADGTTTYPVTIGAGGSGGTPAGGLGTNGGKSQFVLLASGGMPGGYRYDGNGKFPGGSGGGGATSNIGGLGGLSGEGYGGGNGNNYTGNFDCAAGGGGGAGGNGTNASSGTGGNGGTGLASTITGSSVTYAGGGGGGGGTTGGSGGSGGGGDGGSNANGNNGTANTGGGGGGSFGSTSASRPSGNGGSGVVIIRYPSDYTISQTGLTLTTATDGSDKVTTITAGTGTVSWS